jgi:glucosamine--fructose-6-phosphate aminotransferase (isomerizing)
MSDYLNDILNQPTAIRDTLAGLKDLSAVRPFRERLASGDLRRVMLTGMGSSYHALHPLHLTLIARGLTAQMIETSELIHHASALLEPRTLVVAVSQSGRSAEIVRLLDQARGRTSVVAVTNTVDSPLATWADAVVLTRAGSESTVSCKTYVAALAALALVGDSLSGQDVARTLAELEAAPEAAARYLADWEAHVAALRQRMAQVKHLIIAGRGASLAAVGTAGLIIKEAAHFPAEGMSAGAFRHGPLEMVSPELFVLVYAGNERTVDLNARLVADVRAVGGQAALVRQASEPEVFALPPAPELVRPLLEILPAQMISLALAQLRGHAAGRFEHGTKVMTTE